MHLSTRRAIVIVSVTGALGALVIDIDVGDTNHHSGRPVLVPRLSVAAPAVIPRGTFDDCRLALRFRDLQFHAAIGDAGTSSAFTAFVTSVRDTVVTRTSAAKVTITPDGPVTFATRGDAARWRMAGAPSLQDGPAQLVLPSGAFGFAPTGLPITYRDARRLPASPLSLTRVVEAKLSPPFRPSVLLRQLGFLIGTAPLTPQVRAAALTAARALPGVHRCGVAVDGLNRRGQGECVNDGFDDIELVVRMRTGTVLDVIQRVAQASGLFPDLRAGATVESDTFTRLPLFPGRERCRPA